MAKTPRKNRASDGVEDQTAIAGDPFIEDAEIVVSAEDAPEDLPEQLDPSPPNEAQPNETSPDEARPDTQTTPLPAQVSAKGAGLSSMLVGGAVSAAIGFGAAWYVLPKDDGTTAAALSSQSDALAALASKVETLSAETVALGSDQTLKEALTAFEASVATQLTDQKAAIDALETRLNAVERAPSADGSLSQVAIDAFEADLANLRSELADQTAQMQGLAQTAAAQLEQTTQSAAEIEQSVTQAARTSTVRVALARIQSALASGAPYVADLPDLQMALGTDLDAAIMGPAETGVPTLAALQEAYPDAARSALATARAEGLSGEDESTFSGFLRTVFDVRSVEPRTGDTADAILSRAEAALRDARLTDTMAEVQSLPEVARADFAEWIALAQTRLDALAAVEALTLTLPEN